MGKGFAGIEEFATILNMKSISSTTFLNLTASIHEKCIDVLQDTLAMSREKVKQAHQNLSSPANVRDQSESVRDQSEDVGDESEDMRDESEYVGDESEDMRDESEDMRVESEDMRDESEDMQGESSMDIGVSYDGSWLTRGRSSKHGLGCVIDTLTGYVIDTEVMSRYCHLCGLKKKELKDDPEKFASFWETHETQCKINHTGSSGAMEPAAAVTMWERSELSGLRHTTVVSDGDCRTILNLNKLEIYGPGVTIDKEECVNHAEKRLGTALREVVKDCRKRRITLGGKGFGTLTEVKIKRLTGYYGKALRRNKGDIKAMRNDILATIHHCNTTDVKPNHSLCPPGEYSWCFYQSAISKGRIPGSHKEHIHDPLNDTVFKNILPIYKRLSTEDLLERCVNCNTQNANESLHSRIWRICPKEMFFSKDRVEIAVAKAVCEYNFGTCFTTRKIQEALGIALTTSSINQVLIKDQHRENVRMRQGEARFQGVRQAIRLAQARREQELLENEGESYAAGRF